MIKYLLNINICIFTLPDKIKPAQRNITEPATFMLLNSPVAKVMTDD